MKYLCLDFEGVLIPEIWQHVAEATNSKDLMLTTQDIKDYDDLSKTLKKGMSTMSFVTDTASGNAHTNVKNRIHRSNSMMHIWSHSGRRTSAVPPTWSKAKSHGINVNLTSSFKQNNNTNKIIIMIVIAL